MFFGCLSTCRQAGLGITVSGTLFGMSNTLRQELEGVDIHFCDTEPLGTERFEP